MGIDRSILIEDTAVSMRGVLAKADVTGDVEGRVQLLELFYGEDYGTLLVICGGSEWVLRNGKGSMRAKLGMKCGSKLTLTQLSGTPNKITLFSPLLTRGPMNSSSLFTPHLR
jgi:hypothetical protein